MRVRFPPGLVEECLRKCPSSFSIKARNPENDLIVGANVLYMTTFPGLQTIDLDTWEPRIPTRKEYYDGVTVLDALDNLHWTASYVPYFGFENVPPVMSIPEGFAARIRNLTKVVRSGYQKDSEIFTRDMAKTVGADVTVTCMASPPLTYYPDAIESLYRGIEADFPVFVVSGGIMGGTAPATIAGATLTDNAELIGGLVLAQLIKPGAKVMLTTFTFPQNMQSGIPAFGAIECALRNAVSSQYFRRFGIPLDCANPGSGSSKRTDFQCGYEKAMLGILAAVCGANVIYFVGGIFGELTFHPVQAIIDNDIAGMIGRFLQGVQVNEETLALDLIDEVGPIPGMYLDKAHTRTWWKREQFMPKVADRLSLPEWMESGKKSALDYAKEKMQEILATHKPEPLTPKQEDDVERILEEARQYYRGKGLM
ncbi:Glycine betaine methyltransferase [subsurface metagenome]